MVLNFCSTAHQRNFLTIIVSRMETYERAAAMPWSLAYRPISKFWAVLIAISPVYSPHCLPTRFETSRFAEAIPRDGTESDRDLLGSGSPSTGLKNRRRAVVLTDSV